MDKLFIEVDDTSDIEFQVINKIKEQARQSPLIKIGGL